MINFSLTIVDDDADALAHRLVSDIQASDNDIEAKLVRRPAVAGEKGAIEAVGSVAVKILGASGLEHLVNLLRELLTRGNPTGSHEREVKLSTQDGKALELRGHMSNEEFAIVTDRLLTLFERGSSSGTP